jgi:hypothetical protein
VLRAFVAALLVANIAFFAWTQGWLDGIVGTRSIGDREPERMTRQVHPERIQILPPGEAASAVPSVPAPIALACLEAGPFSDAEAVAAQAALRTALPGVYVADVRADKPGAWMIYMGGFASREAIAKKQQELGRRNISYDEVRDPVTLAPGLSLGHFKDRAIAVAALGQFAQQGIHTARVVELAPPSSGHVLRIEKADAAQVAQVTGLRLTSLGKGFAACAAKP